MSHSFTRFLRRPVALAAATVSCLVFVACGGGGGDDQPSPASTETVEPGASTPAAVPASAPTSASAPDSGNGDSNDTSVKALTYSQLSACPTAMEPLWVDKIGCVKGYFDGKIFEQHPDNPREERETDQSCRLTIANDGAITFEWRYQDKAPVVATQPLVLESKSEPDPSGDGIRTWVSSLSTEENNVDQRISVLQSGTGQVSSGGGGFNGLVLRMVQNKAQQSIALEAREALSDEGDAFGSCRAVLR